MEVEEEIVQNVAIPLLIKNGKHMLTSKTKIFISHAWEDKQFVQRLEKELKVTGVDIWIDHSDVRGGDQISKRVNEALEWCNILLLIWSHSANESKWVASEWGAAFSNHKRIIPCLLDDTKLPALLVDTVYVDFRNYDNGLEYLLYGLKMNKQPIPYSPTQEINNSSLKQKTFQLFPEKISRSLLSRKVLIGVIILFFLMIVLTVIIILPKKSNSPSNITSKAKDTTQVDKKE